ncbi:hypothetical protein Tco_1118401 [Tanacetum coccineum]
MPTELKELPSKFTELTGELKGLKKHVHELEIELPRDLKDIPNKLETFTSTVKSLTTQVAKIKTLDALPSLLSKVTEALNKFAQLFQRKVAKDAERANLKSQPKPTTPPPIRTTITPLTTSFQYPFLQSPPNSSYQTKGEPIKKDKGKKAIFSKDAEEEGSEVILMIQFI